MLLSLLSHYLRFYTFQTPCLQLSRASALHSAVTVTNMLSTNIRCLLHIQKTHGYPLLPQYQTQGNLDHNLHVDVRVETALEDTPYIIAKASDTLCEELELSKYRSNSLQLGTYHYE
ncbi:hypothetical protein QL285_093201 [Trifolium repens]|nr:hypothetical protein QL285_093201 [Trifolium repens]